MVKSITVRHEKRGRPATGKTPTMTLRLPDELSSRIDGWAEQQTDAPVKSEAIRRLVEIGLAGATTGRAKKSAASAKSSELAAAQIDKMVDAAVPAEEQATRKRRLLTGPSEFRDVRIDRKKK